MIKQVIKKTIDLGDGRTITIETGKLAKQADGAVEVLHGQHHAAGYRMFGPRSR